jgi:outer membrane receptor protein involved in Fe transport
VEYCCTPCAACGSSLSAAERPAEAAEQARAVADYDLPAQALGDTLRAIARISGRDILFASDIVRGRRAPAVKGRLSLDQALQAALAGSPLTVEYRAGAALIRTSAPGSVDQPATDASKAITVTGTRIRGAGSASPVTVNTRRELEQSGISDLAGYIRILPQNYTGGQNPGIAGGGEQGGQSNLNNSATLNLRGLGPDATLTLLDGHRLAYDALDQGIDISAIPLAAVERIEVVSDGASALYGSDAVGGVANIILRRDYGGLETTARAGTATSGGDVQHELSLVGGHRWGTGGFMVALDHSGATPIYAGQRDYARTVDPSLTLIGRNRQLSGVLRGHQQIAGSISLDLDAYAMSRSSRKQTPFLPNASVFVQGLVTEPHVRSYGLTPTLRADLGAWQAALSATRAVSRTQLDSSRYFSSAASLSELNYDNRLSGIEATAEGPLFALPGGAARLAAGGGLRRLSLHDKIVDIIGGKPVPFREFTESRDVRFAYGELSLPLVGPGQALPLVDRLTLSGAIRYEQWKGIDSAATPKVGIIYQPHRDVTLRATWGKSFKAPTLFQVNEALQGALLPGFIFKPAPQPPGSTVLLLGGGNPGLKSEHATSWSATAEIRPHAVDGLELRATYFHVDYRDRIGSPLSGTLTALGNPLFSDLITINPSAAEIDALVASLPQGLLNQTGQPFNPANVGAIIDGSLRNTARQRIHGVDLEARYRAATGGDGHLLLTGAASYLDSNQQLAPGQPTIQMAGTIFNPPHWRGRAGAIWESPGAGLSAFVNYVGSTIDSRFPEHDPVGAFVTLDVTASLRTGPAAGAFRNIELQLSALNLLGETPDIIRNSEPEAPPYDSTNQSPVGRFIGISIRKAW